MAMQFILKTVLVFAQLKDALIDFRPRFHRLIHLSKGCFHLMSRRCLIMDEFSALVGVIDFGVLFIRVNSRTQRPFILSKLWVLIIDLIILEPILMSLAAHLIDVMRSIIGQV